jgi:hypothetical protein
MFFLIITTLTLLSVPILIKIDAHKIVYETIEHKYSKWKQLNNLVSVKHRNKCSIITVSIGMILKSLYLSFIQYLNNSVKKINKNQYEVSYIINGKLYKMVVSPMRGPAQILQIIDHNENDVTDNILCYVGPRYDWHNTKFTPNFFNCEFLTFQMADGNEIVIRKEEFLS